MTPRLTDVDLERADTLAGHHAGWCAVHLPVADVVGLTVPDEFCTCGAWEFGVMYVDMLHDLRAIRAAVANFVTAWAGNEEQALFDAVDELMATRGQ